MSIQRYAAVGAGFGARCSMACWDRAACGRPEAEARSAGWRGDEHATDNPATQSGIQFRMGRVAGNRSAAANLAVSDAPLAPVATRLAGDRFARCVIQGAAMPRPLIWCALLIAGCGGEGGGAPDAGSLPDAVTVDAAGADAGGLPLAGFGELGGDCDVLDTELTAPEPFLFQSSIEFAAPFTDDQAGQLTAGGQEILADGNAGGSSLYSEIFAFELLGRCELAPLLKTEKEVHYEGPGAITDLLVEVDGDKIGVSVTRAVAFPFDDPYTVAQAHELLEGKLADILESTGHVAPEDRWRKQILAVLAYAPGHADSLAAALDEISGEIRADTIVWILVSDGADDFIYCDGPCSD